jgi:hypothetical protein
MHLTSGQILFILFLFAGWWMSGALALVNPALIVFSLAPPRFKRMNLGACAIYSMPGLVLLLAIYDYIKLPGVGGVFWIGYAIGIPFITSSHFVFLLRTRRRLCPTPARKEIAEEAPAHVGPRCVACCEPLGDSTKLCAKCGWTQPA